MNCADKDPRRAILRNDCRAYARLENKNGRTTFSLPLWAIEGILIQRTEEIPLTPFGNVEYKIVSFLRRLL